MRRDYAAAESAAQRHRRHRSRWRPTASGTATREASSANAKEIAMKRATIALLLCQAATLALAQAAVNSTSTSTSTASTAGGSAHANAASFRCGGVGADEQERIKAEAASHDLLVTFARSSGAYMADVDVDVRSGGRTVLQGHCGGPLMLLDLAPKGTYEIRARANGVEQHKTVTVGGKPARVTFTWPG
jgi:hypothetical protein